MRSGIILGTNSEYKKVNEIIARAGFENAPQYNLGNSTVSINKDLDMRVQIHSPRYFSDQKGVKTEMELNIYEGDNILDYKKTIKMLKKLSKEMPDLNYRRPYGIKESKIYSMNDLVKRFED